MNYLDITQIFKKNLVILDGDTFKNKDEMFNELSALLHSNNIIDNKEAFIKALYEREEVGPTYMGDAIALPHGQNQTVTETSLIYYRCRVPFKYESYSEVGMVKHIFMLAIANDGDQDYLRLLASLAGMLTIDGFKESLNSVTSFDEMMDSARKFQTR